MPLNFSASPSNSARSCFSLSLPPSTKHLAAYSSSAERSAVSMFVMSALTVKSFFKIPFFAQISFSRANSAFSKIMPVSAPETSSHSNSAEAFSTASPSFSPSGEYLLEFTQSVITSIGISPSGASIFSGPIPRYFALTAALAL